MEYKDILIPCFSGFYGSKWDDMIDRRIEDEKEHLIDTYDVDEKFIRGAIGASYEYVSECKELIAKWYADIYFDLIYHELDLRFNVESVSITSPRYYNYETDRIFATVSIDMEHREVLDKILELMRENHEELRQIIKDNHTSYDGFWSWMSNDVNEWPDRLDDSKPYMAYVLAYLVHIKAKKESWAKRMDKYGFLDYLIYEAIYDNEYLPTPQLEAYCSSDRDEWEDIQDEIKRIETRRQMERNQPVIPGLFDD